MRNVLLAAVLLLCVGATPPTTVQAVRTPMLPLELGTKWVWRGRVQWTLDGTSTVRAKRINWSSEVVERHDTKDLVIAIIRGWPSEVDWYDEEDKPSLHVVVKSAGAYYLLDEDASVARARQGHVDVEELNCDTIFLRDEVVIGQLAGSQCEETRDDHRYEWYVQSKSVNQSPETADLIYRTNPDHCAITWKRGVGIAHYIYVHHGTVAEADLKLVSFHRGNKR